MAESTTTTRTHPTYTFVEEKDADAIGWIFVNEHEMKRLSFKFPPIKPHEIRAKVTYTGLCLTDAHIVDGRYFPCSYPICPGHEIVGIVTHIGSSVKDFTIGEKVGFGTHREFCSNCEFCKKGYDNLCCKPTEQLTTYGAKYWGGYATSIQHPAQCYFKLPEGLPEEKIAPLFCAGITCYNPVARYTQPGDEVAVLAVGGLGHMAVQYAKAKGCKVTAFTSSLSKEEFIKKLGAERVVLNTPENLKAEAKKYHLIINTLPDITELTPLPNLARPLGVFCQLGGCHSGASFNPMTLLFGNVSVVGSNTGSVQEIKEMLEFSAKHKITPICEQFDFEDMPKAFDRLVHGKPIFRCVVDMTKAGPKKS